MVAFQNVRVADKVFTVVAPRVMSTDELTELEAAAGLANGVVNNPERAARMVIEALFMGVDNAC